MRAKTPKLVVTFSSTSDAMAMEAAAQTHGIPGRIIPVPSEIDAGCGLAWCTEADCRDNLETALADHALAFEGLFDVMLY